MNRIYLDNAATTPLDPSVLEAMKPYFTTHFGNPSSIYSYGREARLAIEQSRKTVAGILHVRPAEVFFTSGGTESSNTAITASVYDLGCRHIISSPIEHHATLHTIEYLQQKGVARVSFVKILPDGHIDLDNLEMLLAESKEKCLVTLLHGNNEIGNITNIKRVGELCKKYNAIYHADTVQTLAHIPLRLHDDHVHFISGSAHKFHGPKGSGILYINENIKIQPFIHGGAQERNMRAGTENTYGIVGFAKALELAVADREAEGKRIASLKSYMIEQLQQQIEGVSFNGDIGNDSLYTILNVNLPQTAKSEMILFNLDMHNICASGGSACSSGANAGSHVISFLHNTEIDKVAVRFSFSKYNAQDEIDTVIQVLKKII